jgi:RHS repeat-associated protein
METITEICSGRSVRYVYRADGMRIKKIDGLTINWVIDDEITGSEHYDEISDVNMPTYRYYYDGQMCMEEDKTWGISQPPHGPNVEVTQYGIGARGIDYIYKKFKQAGSSTWNTTAEQFPLYDGHGNMVATLSRDGSSFAVNNKRTYDVWGGVRNETDLDNAPNTKYCANLGHKEDDESGLIYMRARYYEPWTGRFVSEDSFRNGTNWYTYAHNNPVTHLDPNGNETEDEKYYKIGYELRTLAVFMLGHGFLYFTLGVAQLYFGRLIALGSLALPGPLGKLPGTYVGIGMMLLGASNAIGGANLFVRGLYVMGAANALLALGEDGLEFAMLYLQAVAKSNVPHLSGLYVPDAMEVAGF